ncbi:hypothetical protein KY290_010564 [Solanum tuberosum]|uniref:CCHC-type domain-containing protein n=1 Tax=Solanum tuberosum TaxID=4113 RepID=A0ABQ7VY57_SOLTU|nr:hypothetical protein KY290_010564 [Solanum tuberosum]
MICGCGLNHYIDGSEPVPPRVLDGDQPNPTYKVWVRQDQLVGAETTRVAWEKLVAAYATGSKPLIRELKAQLHNLRRDNATIECYVQGVKAIADKLAALQHPVTNDNLVEFVLAGLGPAYRPFTRSFESHHEDVTFDVLYGMLLNEERQLKREDASNVISPIAQYTQSSISTQCGRGRGSTSRGRGRFSSHGSSPQSQSRHYAPTTHSGTYSGNPQPSSDFSGIACHNCEGKGHNARVCPSPRTTNGNRVSGHPSSNLASASSQAAQNWLMDSGTTHHLTFDLDNLAIHSAYHGPEEVILGNGSKFPISHIGKESLFISDKSYALDNLLHDLETRATLYKGPNDGGLYSLPILKSIFSPASYAASLGVWHARLAHTSYPTVRRDLPSNTFISSSCGSSSLCPTCAISKSHKIPFVESSFQATGL